jgi:hypothetical protein
MVMMLISPMYVAQPLFGCVNQPLLLLPFFGSLLDPIPQQSLARCQQCLGPLTLATNNHAGKSLEPFPSGG